MAIVTARDTALNMADLSSYAGATSSAVFQGTGSRFIQLNGLDVVEFRVATVNGQEVIQSFTEFRALPDSILLAGYVVRSAVLSISSISVSPAIVQDLAGGAGSTNFVAGLLSGDDQITGSAFGDQVLGYSGNDHLTGAAGNDTLNGGDGTDIAVFVGARADYTVTQGANGSYIVADRVSGRDGSDTLLGIETLQFSDQSVALTSVSSPITTGLTIAPLFAQNAAQAKAFSAAYQVLLGGVPNQSGFDFLIKENLASNFGAGSSRQFNDENIYINITNALVTGNAAAKTAFLMLASGATVQEQIASLYAKLIPAAKQTAEGLAYLTRADGLSFYEKVAADRGIVGKDGPAIVAFASLLKIAVDAGIGVGNPVGDLMAAVANGSSTLPVSGTALSFIETVDGTAFDANDAADAVSVNPLGLAPAPILGVEAPPFMDLLA